ncbi:glutathione S-transferase 1-like [Acropora muricata]|uniref:glutathione S-transferase 1-like n=1 Tax=Acropora muricata TaxID=159855 RepID=UPI0034E41AE6
MSGYKLYYFNSRGRAEICRLAFAAAKIEYEDIRFNREEWAKVKESGKPPFGVMPFIETPGGHCIGGSSAITKYICKKAGFFPVNSDEDEAIADMIVDAVEGVTSAMVKWFLEENPAKKEELCKTFFETTLPASMEKFQNILKKRNEGNNFFLGDKLTYADLIFFNLCNIFAQGEPKVPEQLKNFSSLVDHYNRVLSVPDINAWIEKRPKTEH